MVDDPLRNRGMRILSGAEVWVMYVVNVVASKVRS